MARPPRLSFGVQKDDARKLDHATLEALRIRAVRSVQDGDSPEDVARTLRVTPRAMYRWLALYRRGGLEASEGRHRGPHAGHRQGRLQKQGGVRDAPAAKEPGEDLLLLPKAVAAICRLKVKLLMD